MDGIYTSGVTVVCLSAGVHDVTGRTGQCPVGGRGDPAVHPRLQGTEGVPVAGQDRPDDRREGGVQTVDVVAVLDHVVPVQVGPALGLDHAVVYVGVGLPGQQ